MKGKVARLPTWPLSPPFYWSKQVMGLAHVPEKGKTPPADGRNHREFMAIFNSPQQENGIAANHVQADQRRWGFGSDHHNKADIIIKSHKVCFFSQCM